MTHSPEIGADFRRRLSAPKSGLCVIGLSKGDEYPTITLHGVYIYASKKAYVLNIGI